MATQRLPPVIQAAKALLSRLSELASPYKGKPRHKLRSVKKPLKSKALTVRNPFHTLFKGLSSTVAQINKKTVRENYHDVVKTFIPADAELLTPKRPASSTGFLLADIDGDSQNELIASYRHTSGIRTLILKKQSQQWSKINEIGSSGYETLSYRSVADITGKGGKQLLLGLASKENPLALYGYSLENSGTKELFKISCHRFEILKPKGTVNRTSNTQIAIWNRNSTAGYDIDLQHWNGLHLESTGDIASYYKNSVVPYHATKVRQSPYSHASWYNLAEALAKAGTQKDAAIAIAVGMEVDRKSEFKEKFSRLKSQLTEN